VRNHLSVRFVINNLLKGEIYNVIQEPIQIKCKVCHKQLTRKWHSRIHYVQKPNSMWSLLVIVDNFNVTQEFTLNKKEIFLETQFWEVTIFSENELIFYLGMCMICYCRKIWSQFVKFRIFISLVSLEKVKMFFLKSIWIWLVNVFNGNAWFYLGFHPSVIWWIELSYLQRPYVVLQ